MSNENLENEAELTSYSSSTPAAATNRKAITAPGGGVGSDEDLVRCGGESESTWDHLPWGVCGGGG